MGERGLVDGPRRGGLAATQRAKAAKRLTK